MLPNELIVYIFEFNIDHRLLLKECLNELIQKFNKIKLQKELLLITYGPTYRIPSFFKRNINIYPLINILHN